MSGSRSDVCWCRFSSTDMAWQQQHSDNWWGSGWGSGNNWQGSSSWSSGWHIGHSAPPTRPKKKKPEPEELASPQGYSKQDYGFPATFQQIQEVDELKFPSRIHVRDVSLHELCYQGLNHYHLRSFANGRYLNIVFARSIKESVSTQSILSGLRESKLDLDQVAANYCQQNSITIDKSKTEANIKKLQTQALEEWVAQQLKQFYPPDDSQAPTVASSPEIKRKSGPSSSSQPPTEK